MSALLPQRVHAQRGLPIPARLMSRGDVKRVQRAGRNQNRQRMRGGRA